MGFEGIGSAAASAHTRKLTAAAVIAAGGAGVRMNSSVPKQFLELAGKPILLHTVERLAELDEVSLIVIALPPEHIQMAESILNRRPLPAEIKCVAGGPNRQESVRCGVAAVGPDQEFIMVHDAVRPVCDRDLVLRVLEAAARHGAAVPGLQATETIQRVSRTGRVLKTPPREELYAIQTPQAFRAEILRSSLEKAHAAGFLGTDESSVVRWAGHAVVVTPGSSENLKITRPIDLEIAARLIAGNPEHGMDMTKLRVGQGIDYHQLVEGRTLILGGVEIPFEKGLEGHSDADALLHAICDALLGAAALGDIGRHFPDTDPANRNRPSLEFLRDVRAKVEAAGWLTENIDATLLAQRPRLAPYMDGMKRNIAETLGLDPGAVNIKATTTEGMNAEGRGEGISAHAIALVRSKPPIDRESLRA